ncbi:MAG: hypothetical protein OQL08_12495 [Gammaproteobacteria bacterium]|nr:hypothetical protein [Gammaproteobacteria bacterium]
MVKKRKQNNPLATLLETAPKAKLVDLLVRVAGTRPDVRRECLDYLNRHTALSPGRKKQSEGEKLLTLWDELAPDLDELDAYGGGDYHDLANFHWKAGEKQKAMEVAEERPPNGSHTKRRALRSWRTPGTRSSSGSVCIARNTRRRWPC